MLTKKYYKIAEDEKTLVDIPTDRIVIGSRVVFNPKHEHMIEAECYPLSENIPQDTAEKHYVLEKYSVDTEHDIIVGQYKELSVVDPEVTVEEGQYLYDGGWEETDTEYIHHKQVLDIVDEQPTLEEGQIIANDYWYTDLENGKYIHEYVVKTLVDEGEPYEAEEGKHWETHQVDTDENTITVVYTLVDDIDLSSVKMHISKFALEPALATRGLLAAFDAFIDGLPDISFGAESISVRHLYNTANELNTENQLFAAYFKEACKALGLSLTEGVAIISACQVVIEGV